MWEVKVMTNLFIFNCTNISNENNSSSVNSRMLNETVKLNVVISSWFKATGFFFTARYFTVLFNLLDLFCS
jgi:hypothetical protein